MSSKAFIIIVNFNGWPDTLECLASLEKIDYPNFEVVLIDNASNEKPLLYSGIQGLPTGQAGLTRNLKVYQIYNEVNLGFAAGNNQGIKIALQNDSKYILLLNNDTTVEPDFLKKLVEAAEADEKIGAVGPIICDYNQPDKIQFAGGKVNWLRTRGEHLSVIPGLPTGQAGLPTGQAGLTRNPETPGCRIESGMTNKSGKPIKTNYITGCAFLMKREAAEKIGFLNEDYFLYYEDVDWCLRAKKAGFECVIAPAAKIYHKQSASTREFSYPYIYYHSRNGLLCGWRHGPKIFVLAQSVWIFLKQIIKIIIGYRRNWAKPVMKGVIDFWRGKKRKLEGYY